MKGVAGSGTRCKLQRLKWQKIWRPFHNMGRPSLKSIKICVLILQVTCRPGTAGSGLSLINMFPENRMRQGVVVRCFAGLQSL